MEIGLLMLVIVVLVIANIYGAASADNGYGGGGELMYGISLLFIIILSIGLGIELSNEEPIEQYETKQEWKPRLQINQQNNKQDTIYIYNLNDTNKIK